MTRMLSLIWYWSLTILLFTAMITFIVTLVVCSQVLLKNMWSPIKLPNISVLGTSPGYYYFVVLVPQFLLILIGRLEFLFKTQSIVHRATLSVIHGIGFVSSVFLLIMAIVNLDDNARLHVIGAFGMFGFLSSYYFLHTMVVFYLFFRRSKASRYSSIVYSLYFLVCSVLLIIFMSIWAATSQSIPQYIAASMPFLCMLGFVPQFWNQAKMKRQEARLVTQAQDSNEIRL